MSYSFTWTDSGMKLPVPLRRPAQPAPARISASRLDDVFTRRRVQRRLPRADAEEILSLAPEPDLIDQMPRLFAADLRGALGEDESATRADRPPLGAVPGRIPRRA
jgi:hypothetical protein